MAVLIGFILGMGAGAGTGLGWALQRKRRHPYSFICTRCTTKIRSRWELKRCPACMKAYALPPA